MSWGKRSIGSTRTVLMYKGGYGLIKWENVDDYDYEDRRYSCKQASSPVKRSYRYVNRVAIKVNTFPEI